MGGKSRIGITVKENRSRIMSSIRAAEAGDSEGELVLQSRSAPTKEDYIQHAKALKTLTDHELISKLKSVSKSAQRSLNIPKDSLITLAVNEQHARHNSPDVKETASNIPFAINDRLKNTHTLVRVYTKKLNNLFKASTDYIPPGGDPEKSTDQYKLNHALIASGNPVDAPVLDAKNGIINIRDGHTMFAALRDNEAESICVAVPKGQEHLFNSISADAKLNEINEAIRQGTLPNEAPVSYVPKNQSTQKETQHKALLNEYHKLMADGTPLTKEVLKSLFSYLGGDLPDIPVVLDNDDPRLVPIKYRDLDNETMSVLKEHERQIIDGILSHSMTGEPIKKTRTRDQVGVDKDGDIIYGPWYNIQTGEPDKPKIVLTGGGTGAGKSSQMPMLLKRGIQIDPQNTIKVDSDEIRGTLPEFQAVAATGDGRAANVSQPRAGPIVWDATLEARNTGNDIIYDSALSRPHDAAELIDMFQHNGYEVIVAVTQTDPAVAMLRALDRSYKMIRDGKTPRFVQTKVSLGSHAGFNDTLTRGFKGKPILDQADQLFIFSNTNNSLLVASKKKDEPLQIHEPEEYERMLKLADKIKTIDPLTATYDEYIKHFE